MSTPDLQRLGELLLRTPRGKDPEAGLLLQRIAKDLSARRVRISAESSDVFRTATALLNRFSGAMYAESRLSGLLDCFRFLYQMGDFNRALSAATTMETIAERTQRRDDFGLAKNLQGIALTELGDVGKALLCYSASLEIAKEVGNIPRQASVLGNTGVALNLIGLYKDAIPCLNQSIGLHTRHAAHHSCNLAQSYLELGQFDKGLEAIDRSTREGARPIDSLDAFSMCIREFTYAQLALAIDNLGLAWQRSELCLQYSRASSFRAEALAKIVLALCQVRSGRERTGIKALTELLRESENRLFDSADCLAALVKAYDESGQPAMALEYVTRLLSLVRRNRRKSIEGLIAWSVEPESDAPTNLLIHQSELKARAADRRTQEVTIEMLDRLALTSDIKEDNSGEHGGRVGTLSRLLAEAVDWKASAAEALEMAARLHDIGKIAIPESIVKQPGPLQEHALAFMRSHCEAGAEMLSKSRIPSLHLAESIALYHHEAWDGTGYPKGLMGTRIPAAARIVAIVDAFDALTHERSYAQACTFEEACTTIREQCGKRFDPSLATAFLALVERLNDEFGSVDEFLRCQSAGSTLTGARRRIAQVLKTYTATGKLTA